MTIDEEFGQDLAKEVMGLLHAMSTDEREVLFTQIKRVYCIECWRVQQPIGNRCQCANDE